MNNSTPTIPLNESGTVSTSFKPNTTTLVQGIAIEYN